MHKKPEIENRYCESLRMRQEIDNTGHHTLYTFTIREGHGSNVEEVKFTLNQHSAIMLKEFLVANLEHLLLDMA
jgi:hypothetical protein